MAEKGVDARTITCHFEAVLGRPLEAPEAQALQDGWRAAAKVRHARYHDENQRAADELKRS
jgi:hypothetical protein